MRKFLKIAGIIVFGLIILIGVPGYYFVKNFDLNKYKSYASQLVEEQLGRKFAINGEASIGISLVPTLILEDVELANADWAANPQMVKIQRLELKFALMPLLKKQIVVDKAVLSGPEVYLEVAPDGNANWDFPALKTAKTAAYESRGWLIKSAQAAVPEEEKSNLKALAGFAAKNVVIENGLVNFNDRKSGTEANVVINNVTVSVPGADDKINATFDVVYNNQPVKGKAELGSLTALIEDINPYPVMLSGSAYGINLDLNGSLVGIMSELRYAFETNIYNPAGNFGAPETTLKALIEGDLKKVDAEIRQLDVVNNVVTGTVSADISGRIPAISAVLKSDRFDLTSLNRNKPTAMSMPAWNLIGSAYAADYVPDTAIPYKDMKSINAKADLQVGQLILAEGMQADNVLLKADLNGGLLKISQLRLDFGGGEIDATAEVNANSQSMQLSATSKNILLQNLHKEFAVTGKGDFGILSGGNTDLSINLSGNGATYRQLVQNLKGQVIAIVNQSVIQTGGLQFLTGNFLTEILNMLNFNSKKVTDLDLNCAVVRADLANGRAVFPKGIALSSKQLSLVSDGSLNLVNDKLDFTIQPFSGKVVDTNVAQALSSFFKIKGTVQSPSIALDDKEALKAVVGIAATGGTAYLGSKLLLDPDGSPCYTALINTPYADKFPKPEGVGAATKDVYQDTTKTIETDVKALKDSAKDLLKMFKPQKESK